MPYNRRATYKGAFEWIASTLPHGDLCILSNLDIYYDHSLAKLYDVDMEGKVIGAPRLRELTALFDSVT